MKRIIIAVAIFAFAGFMCVAEYVLIKNTTDSLIPEIENAQEAISRDDIENAMIIEKALNKSWNEKHNLIAVFMSHTVLDDVNVSFDVMHKCLESGDIESFVSESAEAKSRIVQLQDSIACDLHNIL